MVIAVMVKAVTVSITVAVALILVNLCGIFLNVYHCGYAPFVRFALSSYR